MKFINLFEIDQFAVKWHWTLPRYAISQSSDTIIQRYNNSKDTVGKESILSKTENFRCLATSVAWRRNEFSTLQWRVQWRDLYQICKHFGLIMKWTKVLTWPHAVETNSFFSKSNIIKASSKIGQNKQCNYINIVLLYSQQKTNDLIIVDKLLTRPKICIVFSGGLKHLWNYITLQICPP